MAHVYKDIAAVMGFFLDTVFGFFQDSFVGVEQGQSHSVQAGYLKGAAFGKNLSFTVMDIPGTASELTISCFESN